MAEAGISIAANPANVRKADKNIAGLPIPTTDPFSGDKGLPEIWRKRS
jgi:hypothetical protein